MKSRRFPTLSRYCRAESGNIAILFAASAIPLLLLLGGAVDYTRYNRYKLKLTNATDSAALALVRSRADLTQAEAEAFVTSYVNGYGIEDDKFTIADFAVEETSDGYRVSASGTMGTMFLPLTRLVTNGTAINTIDLNVNIEAVHSTNRLELALVIDNTGSMNCGNTQSGTCYNNYASPPANSRIVAVKTAATTLVNTLMRDSLEDPNQIKIALVPFEGMVNVGITSGPGNSWAAPPSWIDWNVSGTTLSTTTGFGKGKFNGVNFEKYNFSTGSAGCTSGTNCKFVGHGWFFRKLNVAWAGCVEMRPSGSTAATNYELTDIAPSTSFPNSLFVPYFWPDEPDSSGTGATSTTQNNAHGAAYTNNYLNDRNGYSTAAAAQTALAKYRPGSSTAVTWQTGKQALAATADPYVTGPNRGCPRPIVPLTPGTAAGKQTILDAIDDMVAYYATGTYIPAGLMWGWHVLSPTAPFTQGVAPGADDYDRTIKALVLFTDGDNTVNSDGNHNGSRYSGWGYITETDPDGAYRLGSTSSAAEAALNAKTATACANAKAAGIRVYTISFGTLDSATTTMMENCATVDDGDTLYYHAPSTSDLEDIFHRIGEDLTEIHLAS